MDQNNTYKFQFSVTCKAGTSCAGQQLASVNSTVIAGTGAPMSVPEPSSIGIFGAGLLALLGLSSAARRREHATGTHGA
jgi:hypothetical protein